ncbi:MAG TPA: FkbM family methyltransferase [Anaerolineaceae bacterium]
MNLQEEINTLLKEDVSSVQAFERSAFDQLAAPYENNIVLFGAGGLGKRTLGGLRKVGIEPIAFTDNNPSSWGTMIDHVPVIEPGEAVRRYGKNSTFVLTILNDIIGHPRAAISRQLKAMGSVNLVSFAFLYWKYPQIFLPYYSLDLPHKLTLQRDQILAASNLWFDEESEKEYLSQLKWRFLFNLDGMDQPKETFTHFPTNIFEFDRDLIFVDCGAFDGDTISKFLAQQGSSFGKILALEPDQANYQKLQAYVRSLPKSISAKIHTYPQAVAGHRGKVFFDAQGSVNSAISETGKFEVECIPLDEILVDHAPTLIKMDIEGAEPDALDGMRNFAKAELPILEISVYHQYDHLWTLPLKIRDLSNRYRLFLRAHRTGGFDLVCYAVPDHRLHPGLKK